MHYSVIVRKIVRRLDKLLYCPIEVFVFHAVSDEFDENANKKVDWSSTTDFKNTITMLNSQYTFISLTDAYRRIKHDFFRRKKYAVLTCDDGYYSVLAILPFLEEKKIPITLFINPKYLDGVSKREEFYDSTTKCTEILSGHPRYIPYFAYTWGRYTDSTQSMLKRMKIIPVLTDGESNYRYHLGIGRRPIDSYYLRKKG